MTISNEVRQELENFPAILKQLVANELAAGNEVVEIGHSFPAPPAGAYFKMRRKVTTRPRESGDGFDFYERQSSQYSGQFTDDKGFYFVLEPPDPPPEEIDMDAIRRSLNSGSPTSDQTCNQAESSAATNHGSSSGDRIDTGSLPYDHRPTPKVIAPSAAGSQPYLKSSAATSQSWLIYITTSQAPYELKEELEANFGIILGPTQHKDCQAWSVQTNFQGVNYTYKLEFLSASETRNCFSLDIQADWSHLPGNDDGYLQRSSASWVDAWTYRFDRQAKRPRLRNDEQLYAQRRGETVQREAAESSIEAIQGMVIAKLKNGAVACTSHKEGDTRIGWSGTHYLRVDSGEYPDKIVFGSDEEILNALFQFYQYTPPTMVGRELSELDRWKLILRRLH